MSEPKRGPFSEEESVSKAKWHHPVLERAYSRYIRWLLAPGAAFAGVSLVGAVSGWLLSPALAPTWFDSAVLALAVAAALACMFLLGIKQADDILGSADDRD